MEGSYFPGIITSLPEIDSPIRELNGWILQGEDAQIVFLEIDPPASPAPPVPHTHGAEYVMILEGEVTISLGGKSHRCGEGDTLYIPAGEPHSMLIRRRERAIGYFFDRQRFKPKISPNWGMAEPSTGVIQAKAGRHGSDFFPDTVTRLPLADIPYPGVVGWLFQGHEGQVVFLEYQSTAREPPHTSIDQWLVILDGEMTIYLNDVPHHCQAGDSLFIPAGTCHYAVPRGVVRSVAYLPKVATERPSYSFG